MIIFNDNNKKFNHINEMKWISMYVKKYWKSIFVYTLIGVIGTVMSLIGSLISKNLIDIVTGYQTGKILVVALGLISFGIASIIFSGISKKVSAFYNIVIQNEIQSDVYNKVLESDWEALNEFRGGDLLNRINGDVSIVSSCIISWIPNLFIRGFQFIGSLLIIVYYDFSMAVIALISVPFSAVISRYLLKKMRSYNEKLREASSEMMSFQEDTFQNIQSIKAFDVINYFENKMQEMQQTYKKVTLSFNTLSVATTSFMSLVAMLVSYACMGWGIYRLWTGAIVFGTLTLFMQLASNLNSSFSAIMSLVPQAVSAVTSAGRIMDIISLPKEYIKNEKDEKFTNATENLKIKFDGVCFNYKNKKMVLDNISFEVNEGDIIGVIGPTGEGKTTLLRLLLGLVKPYRGRAVLIKGNCEKEISAASRHMFSYVPQDNTLFAGTIKDNLTIGVENKSDEQLIGALKDACAWEFVNSLPDGLMSEVKERGKSFSQGQAQRLAIARALLKDAPIILLDEATSALDSDTEKKIIDNIFKSQRGKICFFVTHRSSVFEVCDKIFRIENGQLHEEDKECVNTNAK